MKNTWALKNALSVAAMIAVWFGFALLLGQEDNLYLKAANFLIVAWGIHRSINQWRKSEDRGNYLQGLGLGVRTGFFAVSFAVSGKSLRLNHHN